MNIAGLIAAVAAAALLPLCLDNMSAPQHGDVVTLMERADFDADLSGWERIGEAEFAQDTQQAYEGRPSARMRIGTGVGLSYQQIRREPICEIREGDELQAVVWVRSEGVDADPGAYLALEFVGADGSRAGIAHSRSSASNGARGWERLEATGQVPHGTARVRISLILHAHGTAWFAAPSLTRVGRQEPWPDLGDRVRRITIDRDAIANPHFRGVGFHAFHHIFPATDQDLNEVIYKRWREMNPSFVRLNDHWDYDRATMERIAGHMARMKETGTEIYLTSWNPPDIRNDADLASWARRVADNLEFYVREKGLTNLRHYCMTNELSLPGQWGSLVNDLPRFRRYHVRLADEIKRRGLGVGLLATDASPIGYWHSIEWAAEHMDGITAIYGGHHYFNEHDPEEERFYPWFRSKLEWGVGMARAKGKQFILGEFGAKQDGRTVDGVRLDRCVHFETPREPLVTIQLAEAVIAAINAGVYGMGYWTFMDLVDDFSPGYLNRWGAFRCSGTDRSTRAIYYGYALLTRCFRGPSTAYRVGCDDPRVRAAAVRHENGRTWSAAVVNRNSRAVPIEIEFPDDGPPASLRRYVYDPASVKHHPFGDLPGPSGVVQPRSGKLTDRVGPMTLTVYTSAFDDVRPGRVGRLRLSRDGDDNGLSWQAVAARDVCYYRVYRVVAGKRVQVGSTIATEFTDRGAPAGAHYAVTAVDMSGNEGP